MWLLMVIMMIVTAAFQGGCGYTILPVRYRATQGVSCFCRTRTMHATSRDGQGIACDFISWTERPQVGVEGKPGGKSQV